MLLSRGHLNLGPSVLSYGALCTRDMSEPLVCRKVICNDRCKDLWFRKVVGLGQDIDSVLHGISRYDIRVVLFRVGLCKVSSQEDQNGILNHRVLRGILRVDNLLQELDLLLSISVLLDVYFSHGDLIGLDSDRCMIQLMMSLGRSWSYCSSFNTRPQRRLRATPAPPRARDSVIRAPRWEFIQKWAREN